MEVVAVVHAMSAITYALIAINVMLFACFWRIGAVSRGLKRIADALERRNKEEFDKIKINSGGK